MKSLLALAMAGAAVLVAAPAQADEDPPPPCQILIVCGQPDPPSTPTPPPPADPAPPPPPAAPTHHHQVHVFEDRRPCVAKVEWMSARALAANHKASRHVVEERWEVVGMANRHPTPAGVVFAYPRCGFDMDEAWYGVIYSKGHLWSVTKWRAPGR